MREPPLRVRSLAEAELHVQTFDERLTLLEARVRREEKWTDTRLATKLWKRVIFWLDGWPATRLVAVPARRPWNLERWLRRRGWWPE